MKRSTDRILTTHVGSLVRPQEVADIMSVHEPGRQFSSEQLATLRRCIAEAVRLQSECGIDIPSDGEFGKSSFSNYAAERLSGFELRPANPDAGRSLYVGRDRKRFADAYEEIARAEAATTLRGGGPTSQAAQAFFATVCTGPISYIGQQSTQVDIDNFKAALQGLTFEEAFIPAAAPGTIELQRRNEYYKTQDEYLFAIAEAMATEYRMIVDSGFILQLDDPRVVVQYDMQDPAPTIEEYREFAGLRVAALNHALKGLPAERIRYHLCWGSWHGPHTTDVQLKDIVDIILRINCEAISVEAANPRHEHEYHVWEKADLQGKFLIPGVVAHTTNCVEHPELIAERLVRYANMVGRENVMAGVDCGFGQGAFTRRVPPSIVWEKFRMLSEGARLASKQLWG